MIDTLCIELTARCPLRCVHCSANAAPERREAIPAAILATRLGELEKLKEIYLSGGEPFEHPDFLGIVEAAANSADVVVAYSSGTRLDADNVAALPSKLLERARESGLSRLDLSLYGPNAITHEAVTRVSGSFHATIETAQRARSAGLGLGIHFVPIGEAAATVVQVNDLARGLGAERFHVLALAAQGRAKTRAKALAPVEHFWMQLAQVAAHTGDRELILSSAIRARIGHVEPTPRDQLMTAFIDSRGFLYPGEGQRSVRVRSMSSILSGASIGALWEEVTGALESKLAAG